MESIASVAPLRSVMSNGAAKAFGILFAISPARCTSRPLIPTVAPAAAMPRAISSPSPRVAPVTSATLPAREKRSSPSRGVIDRVPANRLLHPYGSHQHPQGLSRVRLRQPRRRAAGGLGRVRAGQEPRVDQDAVLLPHRQRPPLHQRAGGSGRARALERRRGGLG